MLSKLKEKYSVLNVFQKPRGLGKARKLQEKLRRLDDTYEYRTKVMRVYEEQGTKSAMQYIEKEKDTIIKQASKTSRFYLHY